MKLLTKKTNKQIIIQSRDYNRLKKIKIFNIFLLFIVLTTLGTTFWFVYTNVYKTLGQIEDISLIQNIKNLESINFKNYNNAVAAWQDKNQPEGVLTPTRDPFNKTLIIPTSTLQTETITIIVSSTPDSTNTLR